MVLATVKSQIAAQLATPGKLSDNVRAPVPGNRLPAVLLRFEFHESCCDDTHARSRRIWTCEVLSLPVVPIVPGRERVNPTGEVRSLLFMAAVVREDKAWVGAGVLP
jgi:hypothetical protein